jgi:hypothetical protein
MHRGGRLIRVERGSVLEMCGQAAGRPPHRVGQGHPHRPRLADAAGTHQYLEGFMTRRYITVAEAAEYLQISPTTGAAFDRRW